MSAPIMSRFDLFFVLIDECDENVDVSVARKILNVHLANVTNIQNDTNNSNQKYSIKDAIKFISFARLFKPKLSIEAKEFLVKMYKKLRMSSKGSSSSRKNTFDITVRQLESMIRLSEAIARMKCADVITESDSHIAYNLLTNSIVNVEQHDINLGNFSSNTMTDEKSNLENIMPQSQEIDSTATKLLSQMRTRNLISYEEYSRISNMLVMKIKWIIDNQELVSESSTEPSNHQIGAKRSEIINWYLESVAESEINSEDDLKSKQLEIEAIIDRLVKVDKVLIQVNNSTLRSKDEALHDVTMKPDDLILLIHPNYAI